MCLYPGIPLVCLSVLERCVTNKLLEIMPDQLTVNQYESGQGELLQPRLLMTWRITYTASKIIKLHMLGRSSSRLCKVD